jgi:hypothetical protein
MSERVSYDLNVDMLNTIEKEFDVKKLVEKFAKGIAGKGKREIESVAKRTFGEYGESLMKRTLELGEKYTDQTYEILKEAIKNTGRLKFPHIPQRFIEIAYLSIQPFNELNVVENNQYRFIFRVDNCSIFSALKEACGEEVANQMYCKRACLAASETAYKNLNLKASVSMDASMAKDRYCQFAAKNLEI